MKKQMNNNVLIGAVIVLMGAGLFSLVNGDDENVIKTENVALGDNTVNDADSEEWNPNLSTSEKALISIFEKSAPSVVYINTSSYRRDYFSRNIMEIPRGSGSGFVWDKNGHIVTNWHVIEGAKKITVSFVGGETYEATLVGEAKSKDLALLKLDEKVKDLKPLKLGNSEQLKVGQSTIAIGNPFGMDHTLTIKLTEPRLEMARSFIYFAN